MSRDVNQILKEHVGNQAVQICQLVAQLEFINEVMNKVKEKVGVEELDKMVAEVNQKPEQPSS